MVIDHLDSFGGAASPDETNPATDPGHQGCQEIGRNRESEAATALRVLRDAAYGGSSA
jgi:hypothetical protein